MMDKVSFVETYCNRPDDSEEIKETRAWLKANVLPHMIEAAKEGKIAMNSTLITRKIVAEISIMYYGKMDTLYLGGR